MQSYKEKSNDKINSTISGYLWLKFYLNHDEIGAKLGLTVHYVKHIPMFREFLDLERNGEKKVYIYEYLGEKYKMHPSSVKRVITMFLREVRI